MSNRRVLVVDDEVNVRLSMELHLRRAGYEVSTAEDGEAALAAILQGTFDIVLCDLIMPKLTGVQLLDALAARGISIDLVLMSAHADLDTALDALKRGAVDFIQKGARFEEVLFRLRRIEELRRLQAQVKASAAASGGLGRLISDSAPMQKVFAMVRKVADFKTTVLLHGESGTGKELVARALHDVGVRKTRAFVAVNCGAIPENLLESELFGHVRGAFTDATRTHHGLFEQADCGTLFLDEIGELPLSLQVKLLRVLQEEEIRKVGDTKSQKVDVRVVAATVRDLAAEVKAGRFREDLYYRLNVLQIALPPLRDRPTDIPMLVEHFRSHLNVRLGTRVRGVTPGAMRLLERWPWPGNVRELENCIERAIILVDGDQITEAELPPRLCQEQDRIQATLAAGELSIKKTTRIIEEELMKRALARTKGNRTRAAALLEISHRTLLYKLKDYGLGD